MSVARWVAPEEVWADLPAHRRAGWGERRRSASIAVRPELQDRYNAELQEPHRSAVWLIGCRSWYLDASGNNRALWPEATVAFRRRTKHLRQDEYWFGEVRDHIARTDHNSY